MFNPICLNKERVMNKVKIILFVLFTLSFWQTNVFAAESHQSTTVTTTAKGAAIKTAATIKDAVIKAKLDTLYSINSELGRFDIATKVNDTIVTLNGTVQNEDQKSLAEEIANDTENVSKVINNINIDKGLDPRPLLTKTSQKIADATITTLIKSKLLADSRTHGLAIKVITENNVVTLSGQVSSIQEKNIAQQIALQTSDVKYIKNNILVKP
jgi:osmotically-inducible protein OsmY